MSWLKVNRLAGGYSYETFGQLGTLDAKCAEEPALDIPIWSECYQ